MKKLTNIKIPHDKRIFSALFIISVFILMTTANCFDSTSDNKKEKPVISEDEVEESEDTAVLDINNENIFNENEFTEEEEEEEVIVSTTFDEPVIINTFYEGPDVVESNGSDTGNSVDDNSNQPASDPLEMRNYRGLTRLSLSSTPEDSQTETKKSSKNTTKCLPGFGLWKKNKDVKAILIDIKHIEIHCTTEGSEGWIKVIDYGEQGRTFDLLHFENGLTTDLGFFNLEPGSYNLIRIKLLDDNLIVIKKDEGYIIRPLKVPFGKKFGMIMVGKPFEVAEEGLTSITVDFKSRRSLHYLGKRFGYFLIPVIKIADVNTAEIVIKSVSSTEGGEVNVLGEMRTQIPPEAFSMDTDVSLQIMGTVRPMPFSSTYLIGNTFELGTVGTILFSDMIMTMNYQDADVIGKNLDETELDIYYYLDENWHETAGIVDTENNTVTSNSDILATYGIGGPPLTAPRIDPAMIEYASDGINESESPLSVKAKIIDPDGDDISMSVLYYKKYGELAFYFAEMISIGNDWYEAEIPLDFIRDELSPMGIEVFLDASNADGEISYAPVTSSIAPHLYMFNPDMDNDGMNDRWELEYGLNISIDDSALDPDNDEYTNIVEYQNRTNPTIPEFIPDPEDIVSNCQLNYVERSWLGVNWDFVQINTDVTVIPPNSADYYDVTHNISIERYYIIDVDPPMVGSMTDTVSGSSELFAYEDPPLEITLYDDFDHIDDFKKTINGKLWSPQPYYINFEINYTGHAWNTSGGSYSEDFNFYFEQ